MKKRCAWVKLTSPEYVKYHDEEWGVPVHDDQKLFEFLILEGAQAGLSWETVLKRREGYRRAFAGFDPQKVACFSLQKLERLLEDEGIIRNKLKIFGARTNARTFLKTQDEFGCFDKYVWRFVEGKPKINRWKNFSELPSRSPESDALSKDLKSRGFTFVGSTICYAFMQAVGLVNDHLSNCYLCKR